MTEPDDSHDLPAMRERLKAARHRLARMPVSNHRAPGPTDPATGESWHRGNVLGHVSEMVPFWTGQIRLAKEGSGRMGRDSEGALRRRHGIDRGDADAEQRLKRGVDEGLGSALELMDAMSPADLELTVVFTTRDGVRDARVGELLQQLIVAHVEEHVAQLEALD